MSFSQRRNRKAFEDAKRQAGDTGRVCGTYDQDGNPIYFVVPKDATDDEIRNRVFEIKHGRPMNRAEDLLGMVQRDELRNAYENVIAHYLYGSEESADAAS